jgi:hypothetical protein
MENASKGKGRRVDHWGGIYFQTDVGIGPRDGLHV